MPRKASTSLSAIAAQSGLPLKIAAKVDKGDHEYFTTAPALLSLPHVEFVGEISEAQKAAFLSAEICSDLVYGGVEAGD